MRVFTIGELLAAQTAVAITISLHADLALMFPRSVPAVVAPFVEAIVFLVLLPIEFWLYVYLVTRAFQFLESLESTKNTED